MALPDWILGLLFRPGQTFVKAHREMRGAYWWILLSVYTVESVMLLFSSSVRSMIPSPPVDLILYNLLIFFLLIFSAQTICLLGAGRFLGWPIGLREAMKFTGLTWSLFLLEDLVTFYPYLKGQENLLFWLAIPFLLWRMAVQTIGVRQISGLPAVRSALIVLLATLPWQVPLLISSWPG